MMRDSLSLRETGEFSLWELEIEEVVGESLEAKNKGVVNRLLLNGWILLHIYTLKYKDKDEWRERPMAILGRPIGIGRKKQIYRQ